MRGQNFPALAAYLFCKAEGTDEIESIRLVRETYGLSLQEIKELKLKASNTGLSASEHQESLIPQLEESFRIVGSETGSVCVRGSWDLAIQGHQVRESDLRFRLVRDHSQNGKILASDLSL